ncbi:protein-disulfide reductase DsbD family protein, partial [Singulisphaera rosea]
PAASAPEVTAVAEPTRSMEAVIATAPAPAPAVQVPSSELEEHAEKGFLSFLLFSALGGLYALAMPCVWPMVPITVNFFVKQGQKNKGKTTGLAIAYCLAIIGVFTAFGVLVSFFFSSKALQTLANNPWLNTGVAFLFLAFGLSLLGLFEIRLPNVLLNASAKGESRGGLVGVMFMALTLTITSFTCTFPVVGTLVVMASKGQFFYPIVGLATFSAVMALPFFVLALAPGLLSKMPKSGDWMNSVKVVGGLVEIGAALKFINTAEIGFGAVPEDAWFDAPLVLSIWVALAAVCGVYLLGLFRTDHDHDEVKIGPGRLLIGSLFIGLALFFLPALFGHPPKSPLWNMVVGIFPADVGDFETKTQAVAIQGAAAPEGGEQVATSTEPEKAEREQKNLHGVLWGMSFDAARERSKAEGRPVLIDFTGVNCMNCRTMEEGVMPRPEVVKLLSQFVTVQLYTDFVPIKSIIPDQRFALAEKNQDRILELAQEATNPFYVVLGPEGQVLKKRGGLIPAAEFVAFLEDALKRYSQAKAQPEGKVALASPVR